MIEYLLSHILAQGGDQSCAESTPSPQIEIELVLILQAVIFLYLLDNETSMVILASSGIGLLIEFWKVTRAMDVTLDRSGSIPRLRFKDKSSYT